MDNSVDRKNAIRLYLTGTIGQITVIAVIVYLSPLYNPQQFPSYAIGRQ